MPLSTKFLGKTFFILVLGVNSLVFSRQLLDYYLGSRFLSASLFLLVFCVGLLVNKSGKKISIGWLDILFVFFVSINGVSTLWADHFSEAIFTFQRWLIFLWVYFLAKLFLQDFRQWEYSFFGKLSTMLGYAIVILASYQVMAIGFKDGFSNDALYAANILFGHKSLIAAFLALLIPMQLMYRRNRKTSMLAIGLIFLEVILILILQSRTVYLSLVAFALFGLYYIYINRAYIFSKQSLLRWTFGASIICVFFAGLMLSNASIRHRLNPISYMDSATGRERTFVWSKTIPLIQENPWLGVGAGNWKIFFPSHGVEGSWRLHEKNIVFTRAHNDFLETFAELGLPGGIAYLICFLGSLLVLSKLNLKNSFPKLLLQAAIVGFMIISFLDFPKERIEFLILIAVYLAMVSVLTQNKTWFPLTSGYFQFKMILILGIAAMSFNLYGGWFRYQGEMKMPALYKARQEQNWDKMISQVEAAYNPWYQHDPAAVPVFHYKGIALYNQQKFEAAQVAFQAAYDDNPYNFHVINNLATTFLQQKDYVKAVELYQEVLKINWKFADSRYNLAYCYVAQGKYNLAREEINKLPPETEKRNEYIQSISQMIESIKDQ